MPSDNSSSDQRCKFLTYNIDKINQVQNVYIAAASLHSLLILPTITFNVILLISLYRSNEMHKASTKLLFSLSSSDLLVGLIWEPTMLIKKIAELRDDFVLYCKTGMITYVAGGSLTIVSLVTLTFIAIDRYLVVHAGVKYNFIVDNKRVIALLIGLWIFAVFFPVGQLFTERHIFFNVAAVIFVVCIGTSSVCYIRCIYTLRKQRRKIGNLTEGNMAQIAANNCRYKKTMYTMLYVFLTFNLCSMPYLCTSISAAILGESPAIWGAESITIFINNTNSLLNPIILLWRMKKIRQAVVIVMTNNTIGHSKITFQSPEISCRVVMTREAHAKSNSSATNLTENQIESKSTILIE